MAYDKPILADSGGTSPYGFGIVINNIVWMLNGVTTTNANAVANANYTYNFNIIEK